MKSGKRVNAGYCKIFCALESTFKKLLNQKIVYKNRKLEIRPHLSDKALAKFREGFNLRRIYIYNVNPHFTDRDVETAFESVGPVDSAYCIRKNDALNRKNNIPMFGYVLFKEQVTAEKAI